MTGFPRAGWSALPPQNEYSLAGVENAEAVKPLFSDHQEQNILLAVDASLEVIPMESHCAQIWPPTVLTALTANPAIRM